MFTPLITMKIPTKVAWSRPGHQYRRQPRGITNLIEPGKTFPDSLFGANDACNRHSISWKWGVDYNYST